MGIATVILKTSFYSVSVKPEVEQRLRDAFKRYANSHMLLHKVYFFREVLGDIIPEKTGEVSLLVELSTCLVINLIIVKCYSKSMYISLSTRFAGTLTCDNESHAVFAPAQPLHHITFI